jgi:hypothetical protein
MTSKPLSECDDGSKFNKKCNDELLKNEQTEWDTSKEDSLGDALTKNHLYPTLNDADFNVKIALKKEFDDAKYDAPIKDVEQYSNELNSSTSFELQPHQLFVKTFLSSKTPYKSVLLYHGLGSGKTCSAIGICEEHRDNSTSGAGPGAKKKIIIIASPNVQDNFKLQLFDKRKLKKENGVWKNDACVGDKLLREISASVSVASIGANEDQIETQVKDIIHTNYEFMGYTQFANMVTQLTEKVLKTILKTSSEEIKQRLVAEALNKEFSDRLIVVDEVHNLRIAEDNAKKDSSIHLMSVVRASDNLRLVLLSATPMYNNYTEIIWLINLMNANDRRGEIKIEDVFYKGGWKKDASGAEVGKELFIRKCTGYISFVRGENPYTFPFRIYPSAFSKEYTESVPFYTFDVEGGEDNCVLIPYPKFQLNGLPIPSEEERRNTIKLTLSTIGSYQMLAYKCIMHNIKNSVLFNSENAKAVFEDMESFGYTLLQKPIEALNIVFPVEGLNARAKMVPPSKKNAFVDQSDVPVNVIGTFAEEDVNESAIDEDATLMEGGGKKDKGDKGEKGEKEGDDDDDAPISLSLSGFNLSNLIGKKGLMNTMNFEETEKAFSEGTFEYKPAILKSAKRGRIFAQNKIGKYSSKISKICNCIYDPKTNKLSDGIILIYSQYIYSGLIPMALALEEMGFTRHGSNVSSTLFKTPPREPLVIEDALRGGKPRNAKYVMITGDKRLSPNNDAAVKAITEKSNAHGNEIKIVLISKAGSEGVDFKAIRQIHIIDPWYNMNRIEQIIGRGVRNFSHKDLPFSKRNVEIFLHATLLKDKKDEELSEEYQREYEKEAADLYVYRTSEKKARQIGIVTRVLKENAVDCIVNYEQTNFIRENFKGQGPVKQTLSVFGDIEYQVGDAPYSSACDYMAKCDYTYNMEYTSHPKDYSARVDELHKAHELGSENVDKIVDHETYVSKFASSNVSKIMQKIKSAFKKRFFYKKHELLKTICDTKSYPLVQIHTALNAFIHDKRLQIEDKYGRPGFLVNIEEYYFFQPMELTSNNDLTLFERVTPVDYKHQTIRFNLQDRIEILPKLQKKFVISGLDEEELAFQDEGNEIEPETDVGSKRRVLVRDAAAMNRVRTLYHISETTYDQYAELKKQVDSLPAPKFKKLVKQLIESAGENEWYAHYGIAMYNILNDEINKMLQLTKDNMYLYLIHHIIDISSHLDKVSLLNYLYSPENDENGGVELAIKTYVDRLLVHEYKQNKYAILFEGKNKIDYETGDDENRKIYIFKSSSKAHGWEPADMVDQKRVIEYINKEVDSFKRKNLNSGINSLIGFIGYEKTGEHLVFKIKDINNLRNLAGARCDQFSKSTAINNLNKLLGSDYLTNDNAPGSTQELGILLELITRHFSTISKNGKIWYLTPEQVELFNIEHCKMNNSQFVCSGNK